jgi:hypothetical protein
MMKTNNSKGPENNGPTTKRKVRFVGLLQDMVEAVYKRLASVNELTPVKAIKDRFSELVEKFDLSKELSKAAAKHVFGVLNEGEEAFNHLEEIRKNDHRVLIVQRFELLKMAVQTVTEGVSKFLVQSKLLHEFVYGPMKDGIRYETNVQALEDVLAVQERTAKAIRRLSGLLESVKMTERVDQEVFQFLRKPILAEIRSLRKSVANGTGCETSLQDLEQKLEALKKERRESKLGNSQKMRKIREDLKYLRQEDEHVMLEAAYLMFGFSEVQPKIVCVNGRVIIGKADKVDTYLGQYKASLVAAKFLCTFPRTVATSVAASLDKWSEDSWQPKRLSKEEKARFMKLNKDWPGREIGQDGYGGHSGYVRDPEDYDYVPDTYYGLPMQALDTALGAKTLRGGPRFFGSHGECEIVDVKRVEIRHKDFPSKPVKELYQAQTGPETEGVNHPFIRNDPRQCGRMTGIRSELETDVLHEYVTLFTFIAKYFVYNHRESEASAKCSDDELDLELEVPESEKEQFARAPILNLEHDDFIVVLSKANGGFVIKAGVFGTVAVRPVLQAWYKGASVNYSAWLFVQLLSEGPFVSAEEDPCKGHFYALRLTGSTGSFIRDFVSNANRHFGHSKIERLVQWGNDNPGQADEWRPAEWCLTKRGRSLRNRLQQ